MSLLIPALLALPWWLSPVLLWYRQRAMPSLDAIDPTPPSPAPRVSVILPARNEAAHIAACVASIRASTWPALEVIVIDDHSTDGTGALARAAAAGDARIRVIEAPDLLVGWFGKQWACHAGAAVATGDLLLFTDADTRHAPELIARMVAMRAQRQAELLSVAGHQATGTVWERAVQPSVFMLILTRYGDADALEHAQHPRAVVANGQCFMLSRRMYDTVGGHVAVREYVAEDLMMAQTVHRHGGRISMAIGIHQLSTRMYDGLASLMKGWGKNLYAGGKHAMWWGAFGQWLYPFLLLAFPLGILAPFATLLGAAIALLTGAVWVSTALLWASVTWAMVSALGILAGFALANRINGDAMHRAILAPLGGAVLLVICLRSIVRGARVEWKDRGYTTK